MADERVQGAARGAAPPPAVHCQNVVYRIRKKTVLCDVSFTVEQGQIAGLLGPNGAGKSSLMKILAGLNPPDSGQVLVYGEAAGPNRLREVAFLPDRARLPGWEWKRYRFLSPTAGWVGLQVWLGLVLAVTVMDVLAITAGCQGPIPDTGCTSVQRRRLAHLWPGFSCALARAASTG